MKQFNKEINNLITEIENKIGKWEDTFLSGGAITSVITGKPVRDYDLYFKTKEAFLESLATMYLDGWWNVAITPRAATFVDSQGKGNVIQLMCFDFFPTAQDIFNKFDFSCCMGAIDLGTKEFFCDENFTRDIAARKLRFNHRTEFPLGSAMRIEKYKEKGYTIATSEYLKVILACSFKNINNWEELKNQIGGQYGEAISLDINKDFSIDNAIASLDNTIINITGTSSLFKKASTFPMALKEIYGYEAAKEILKDPKWEKEFEVDLKHYNNSNFYEEEKETAKTVYDTKFSLR
jgi:hypothetical protein